MSKKFQPYIIVFGCMLLQAIPYCLAQNIPPLFMSYLRSPNTFGFNLSQISFIFTIGMIISSIFSPIGGKLFSKFSIKPVMIAGLLLSVAGLSLNMIATHLWEFYLANAIIQCGCIIYSNLGITYLIGTWFNKKQKVKALGFAFAGGSIGNFFFQPIFSKLLAHHANSIAGIHNIYRIEVLLTLIVGLFVLIVFIHDNHHLVKAQQTTTIPILNGIGAAVTKKLPSFWLLAAGMGLIGMNISAQSVQYANFFKEVDLLSFIGSIGMVFALSALAGNICGGMLFSKFGLNKALMIGFALQLTSASAMLLLNFIHSPLLAYTWAICYGMSDFVYMSGPATMIQDLFGMRESTEILGVFNLFFGIGFSVGSLLFGLIVDLGNYIIAWISILAFIIIGFLLLLTMVQHLEKQQYAHVKA